MIHTVANKAHLRRTNGWYNINRVEEYLPAVNGVTSADVQAMAKKILSDGNLIKVVMRPEK